VSLFKIPITFPGHLSRIAETVVFHLLCHQGVSLGPPEEVILPGPNGQFDLEEGLVFPMSQGEGLGCTMELKRHRSQ
jgi:hypothetical protein